jgi:hypothetical protein
MSGITSTSSSDRPLEGSSGRTDPPVPEPSGDGRARWLIGAFATAVAVIAALLTVLLWPSDEAEDTVTEPTTTEAPATSTTTSPTTTTGSPATTNGSAAPTPIDTSAAVFPSATSGTRYADPAEAAGAYAVEFVGFTDPIVGEFMQGDARSGEVEVRPAADGPATTVFVRQLGSDGSWWVLGSATADITIDMPGAGDAVTSPLTVTGTALAFEGTVAVEVREDGVPEPLGTSFVTGGGDVPRPFTGQVTFTAPTAGHGALVLLTRSEEDGRVWQAAVLRLRFA